MTTTAVRSEGSPHPSLWGTESSAGTPLKSLCQEDKQRQAVISAVKRTTRKSARDESSSESSFCDVASSTSGESTAVESSGSEKSEEVEYEYGRRLVPKKRWRRFKGPAGTGKVKKGTGRAAESARGSSSIRAQQSQANINREQHPRKKKRKPGYQVVGAGASW
jgi:hypothetical protein